MDKMDYLDRCDVYRNLNKPAVTYSIRQRGRVTGYCGDVILRDCTFKAATPSQREACLNRRLVCQWVKGLILEYGIPTGEWVRLDCDPKRVDGFRRADTGERIDRAKFVRLCHAGCFAVL